MEQCDLRGGKEKAELLHVIRALRQAAWSDAIYARWLVGKKRAVNFLTRRSDLASFAWLTEAETKRKALEQIKGTTELEPRTAQ